MTRMLASVRGPGEAEQALAGGADIVELKDLAHGTLGVDRETLDRTVAAVAGRRPIAAMAGEVSAGPTPLLDAITDLAQRGIAFLEVAIPQSRRAAVWLRALAPCARHAKLLAVLFAEDEPDLSLLPALAASGFAGAMLDTAATRGTRLLDHMDLRRLREFVAGCRSHELLSGLSGGLEPPDVPRLLVLRPDILGFRATLCGPGGRGGTIRLEAVQAIRDLMPLASFDDSAPAVTSSPADNGDGLDHVFVRDFVLQVRIGAYAHERTPLQRVRFEVDAAVTRSSGRTRGMRDIFSYDIITDGIQMLADAGHVALLETLAERIAAMLLTQPRVKRVAIRLEKLDTGSGIVGIAIERRRHE